VNTFIDQKLGQTIETALKKLSNEASTYVNEMTSTVMESKVLNTAQKRSVLENSNIGTNTVIAATAEASAETMPSYAVNTAQKVTSDAMAPNSAGNFATGAFDFNGKSNSGDSGAMKLQNFMNASDNPNAKPKK
jgi:protein involved in temperature-dependent protein secretion